MIVATAGHVDHGKTSLVKALTGVDTDRLAEEQRRGMTIELGFAYVDWGAEGSAAAEPIGFVDVPGHERFVRQMLAGVTGIDVGLLVVAADDGPMPQTREHLDILALLGVPRLVVALSKVDRVSPERLAQARLEVAALLADRPFGLVPVVAVVAPSGLGLDDLRQHLTDAARTSARRAATGHFRMAIDRSFTLAGSGRVVTGMVLSGQVQVGDEVVVSPGGDRARVRSLHAQGQAAGHARAGQRCALNLAGQGLKRAEPQRGDWALAPAAHAPTERLDVHLQMLASPNATATATATATAVNAIESPRAANPSRASARDAPLRRRAELQLHIGAAVVNARVSALGDHTLTPGSVGLAQLVLDRPVAAAHGDRFVLRDPAGNRTLAGGWVIDPFGAGPDTPHGRSPPARVPRMPRVPRMARLARLHALAHTDHAQALVELLAGDRHGADLTTFALARNLQPDEVRAVVQGLPLHVLDDGRRQLAVADVHWKQWRDSLLQALDGWHTQHPDSLGPQPAELRSVLGLSTGSRGRAVLQAVLASLVDAGLVVRDGLRHRRVTHSPCLAEADAQLLARITELIQPAGLRPPIVGELATGLVMPLPELLGHLGRLAVQGQLVRVAPNRYFLPSTVAELVAEARALATRQVGEQANQQASDAAAEWHGASIDAATFRDHTGIGRNLTVQVLEFFNREGLTRFDGARHQLLP